MRWVRLADAPLSTVGPLAVPSRLAGARSPPRASRRTRGRSGASRCWIRTLAAAPPRPEGLWRLPTATANGRQGLPAYRPKAAAGWQHDPHEEGRFEGARIAGSDVAATSRDVVGSGAHVAPIRAPAHEGPGCRLTAGPGGPDAGAHPSPPERASARAAHPAGAGRRRLLVWHPEAPSRSAGTSRCRGSSLPTWVGGPWPRHAARTPPRCPGARGDRSGPDAQCTEAPQRVPASPEGRAGAAFAGEHLRLSVAPRPPEGLSSPPKRLRNRPFPAAAWPRRTSRRSGRDT